MEKQGKSPLPEQTLIKRDPIQWSLESGNHDWYRQLLEHSRDLLFIHDLQGRLLSVNPAFARLLGYSVEEMLQIPMREIIAPEFGGQFDWYLPQIERDGDADGLMIVVARSGERRIWKYDNTLQTAGIAPPIVFGLAHDITEQKRAEDRILQYEKAMEGLEEMIAVVDRDYLYVIANRAFLKYRNITSEQLIGRHIAEIVNPGVFESVIKDKLDESFQGKIIRYEMRYTYPDLGERDLSISYFPIEEQGRIDRVACVLHDITECKRIEEDLRQAKEKLAEEKCYLEQEIDTELGFEQIVGKSAPLKEVMEQVGKVAASDASVLLLGETGTGKELVARALHRLSRRAGASFIKMNCAAIPSGLLESELFGYEKGAFTGAISRKHGRLELADKGTLFLDEIGEIPLALQPKLLRVLQDQEFERLGGTQTLKVDFRLIAATNRDLADSVRKKEFRSDLYYRLNVFPVRVPPLRERHEDIRLLVEHFVQKFAKRMSKKITSIPRKTMDALKHWEWPGNVRELENFVERSVILTHGSVLAAPLGELRPPFEVGVSETLEAAEREQILRALQASHGQIGGSRGAAVRLGLKRTTLQSKLKQMRIDRRPPPAGH